MLPVRLQSVRTTSIPALRRLLVTTQGYVPRARRAGADDVEFAIRRVVKAFQSCRRAKAVDGHCTRKVLEYACSEKRPADETIPTQFTGHVTCRRASRSVAFVYQQNT